MSFSSELNKISVSWSTIMQDMQLIRTLGVLFWFFLCVWQITLGTLSATSGPLVGVYLLGMAFPWATAKVTFSWI